MGVLSRIGIALDSELLKRFDGSIQRRGYTNRSEAFRDLIRDRLVTEQTAEPDATWWVRSRSSSTIMLTA